MKTLAILLPLITLVLMTFMLVRNRGISALLNAFIKTHILLFGFIAVSTEVLSLFGWVDYVHVLGVWASLCLCLIAGIRFFSLKGFRFSPREYNFRELQHFIPGLVIIGFLLGATLLTCFLYPPNTWDSMSYHMSRVVNWIHNGNVSFYPTAIPRQNYQMPLAEFAILHLQILSDSDIFSNIVQWLCFTASICLVAVLAGKLGLSKSDQLLSSVVFATIPMAILQASSTQNDLVVTSFILSFVLFMLRLRIEYTWSNAFFASLSLGLAFLTKGTAWVYCPAIGLLLAIPILYPVRSNVSLLTKRTGLLCFMVFFALTINSGHYLRSYQLFGKPIASGDYDYFVNNVSFGTVLANIARSIAFHLGTPSSQVNRYLYNSLDFVLGAQLNNPDSTWPDTNFGIPFRQHEDHAGNPIHMIFAFFAIASGFVWMHRQQLFTNCYVVGVLIACLLYCVFLRWQPWASRLHTPIFALFCPIIVIAIRQAFGRGNRYIALFLIILTGAFSVRFAIDNESRSLLSLEWKRKSRIELYFVDKPYLYDSYKSVIEIVNSSDIQDVGLYLGLDDWEYPFWALGHKKGISFHHVNVINKSRNTHTKEATAKYIVATRHMDIQHFRNEYSPRYFDKNLILLKKKHNQELLAIQ